MLLSTNEYIGTTGNGVRWNTNGIQLSGIQITRLSLERGESRQRVVGDSVFYLYSSTPSFVVSTVEPFRCSDLFTI